MDNPVDAVEFRERGIRLLQQGELAGALAELDEAIRLEADHLETYMLRASVRQALGDRMGFMDDLAQASKIDLMVWAGSIGAGVAAGWLTGTGQLPGDVLRGTIVGMLVAFPLAFYLAAVAAANGLPGAKPACASHTRLAPAGTLPVQYRRHDPHGGAGLPIFPTSSRKEPT